MRNCQEKTLRRQAIRVTGGSVGSACFGWHRRAFRPVCWGGFLGGPAGSRLDWSKSGLVNLVEGVAQVDGWRIVFLKFYGYSVV